MLDQMFSFFQSGLFHIFNWSAWDHLLFVVVLTVPFAFDHWKYLLGWIAALTLSHLIALLLSYYSIMEVSSLSLAFINPLIVLITGLYNVFKERKGKRTDFFGVLFVISLILGGLHGFISTETFSSQLDSNSSVVVGLLSYNFGLFVGLLALCLITLLLGMFIQFILRFSRRDWVLFMSALVIGLVIPMLVKNYPL